MKIDTIDEVVVILLGWDSHNEPKTNFLQIFPLNEKIENINDQYWTLRAEEVCHCFPV